MGDRGGDSRETPPPRGKPGAITTDTENNATSKSEKKSLEIDTALATSPPLYRSITNSSHNTGTNTNSNTNGNNNTNIEEKIGVCLEEFRCQHNNFTGILYAGPLGVVFLGRFLLFEWTVVLQWEDVIKVKRRVSTPTALGKSKSHRSNETTVIRIEARNNTSNNNTNNNSTSNNANRICDFDGFFDASRALETLIGLHNDGILDHTNTSRITKRGSIVPLGMGSVGGGGAVGLRRTHSDPAEPISNLFNFDDESPAVMRTNGNANGNSNANANGNSNNSNKTTMEDFRNQYSASNRAALQVSNTSSSSNSTIITSPPRTRVIRRDSIFRSPLRSGGRNNGNKSSSSNSSSSNSEDTENTHPNNCNDDDTNEDQLLDAEWRKVCNDVAQYPQAPVRDRELPLQGNDDDLDVFVETFVGDSAAFSWSKFMTDIIGDTHVHATKWVASGGGASNDNGNKNKNDNPNRSRTAATFLTRTIEYTHPVNAPMAPPTARARKEQTLKRYGNQRGLVIETKTFVSDVPMTDCFYVRDVLQVERRRNNGGLVVNIRFEVVFVKSNMFRALIARTTTSEFQKIMNDLASYLCSHCGKNGSGNKQGAHNSNTTKEEGMLPIPSPQAIQSDEYSPATGKSRSSSYNNSYSYTTSDQCWKLLVVALLLWMARMQARVWNETSLLRNDLRELQSTLWGLETKRTTEARLLKDDSLREWKTAFGDLETKHVAGMQSLRDDFSDLKSTLLELEDVSRRAITVCSDNSATATTTTIPTDEELQQQPQKQQQEFGKEGIPIPREGSSSGIGRPLLVEPVHDLNPGGYRRSGNRAASYEQMNDWEKLEQCQDCY